MLHLAAMTTIHFDTELREYYIRRQADGKSKMAVINIIRNKIVSRVFAVIKRGTPFVDIKNTQERNLIQQKLIGRGTPVRQGARPLVPTSTKKIRPLPFK